MEGIEVIVEDLATQRDEVLTYFRGMSAQTLRLACTESEHPGGAPWTPKIISPIWLCGSATSCSCFDGPPMGSLTC